jgi:hypothetical protein
MGFSSTWIESMPLLWSTLSDDEVVQLLDEHLSSVAQALAIRATRLMERHLSLPRPPVFHSHNVPDLSIREYCSRLARYLPGCPSAFVLSAVYLDRLGVAVNDYNVHKVLLAALTVAYCHLEDSVYENGYMAKVGGIQPEEMARLQMGMLEGLQFRLNVTRKTFLRYCSEMT